MEYLEQREGSSEVRGRSQEISLSKVP